MCSSEVATASGFSLGRELYLLALITGLYASFLVWGYLQEKITSTPYVDPGDDKPQYWEHATVLNFCVGASSYIVAAVGEKLAPKSKIQSTATFASYAWAALTCVIASPIGYWSLRYISFPLQMLAKSCKLVPVMLVGTLMYRKRHTMFEYAAVALITFGIALFSLAKAQKPAVQLAPDTSADEGGLSANVQQLIGILLVCANIMLDGFTNQEQERIKQDHKSGALQMMKNINAWQCIYLAVFLAGGYIIFGERSDVSQACAMLQSIPQLRWDIFAFACCAALGQLFVFAILSSFGPLILVMSTVTRKLVQVLLSVVIFGHSVSFAQWIGVVLVFTGIGVNTVCGYFKKSAPSNKTKAE